MAPVIGADSKGVVAAIAFTAVLGVLMVLGLPLFIPLVGLSEHQYRTLAGLTVYAAPQVLAATVPIGILALAGLRSVGPVPKAASQPVTRLAGLLTVVSMAVLGLGADMRVLARVGGRVTLAVTGSLVVLLVVSHP